MNILERIKSFLNKRGFTVSSYDKALHFFGCFAGVILLTHLVGIFFPISAMIMLTIGVSKEVYDSRKKGTGFSMLDVVFDILGISLGILFVL